MTAANPEPTFEQARDELVRVVTELEQGGATLEQSIALWERGEALARRCEQWLIGAKERLDAARAAGNQRDFADSVPNLNTYVNTDFIGPNNMPYSAIISGGELVYSPAIGSIGDPQRNGSTRVLGWAKETFSEANGFSIAAPLTSGSLSATVAGVNLKKFPANSIVAFTTKNAAKSIPRGAFAILVSRGKVITTYLKGINIRPSTGTLFQATGTAVAKLKRFTNGKLATYRLPSLDRKSVV